MGEREAERADAVRFLCGEASRVEAEARAADAACAKVNVASVITPKMREAAAALVNAANAIERGDHVVPVERTPETVLRAMLRTYEAALLAAHVAWMSGASNAPTAHRINALESDVTAIRGACAWVMAGHDNFDLRDYRRTDYEMRKAGKRPLDAPPLEVP